MNMIIVIFVVLSNMQYAFKPSFVRETQEWESRKQMREVMKCVDEICKGKIRVLQKGMAKISPFYQNLNFFLNFIDACSCYLNILILFTFSLILTP